MWQKMNKVVLLIITTMPTREVRLAPTGIVWHLRLATDHN
jgi:hypothetical protein